MQKSFSFLLLVLLMLSSCGSVQENKEAKEMLQGIWYNADTNERSLYVKGDTIYYADRNNAPSYFRIVADSLEIYGANVDRYAIYRQGPHLFCFYNLNDELVKLRKGENLADSARFVYKGRKHTIRDTIARDTTITANGKTYHVAIKIAPNDEEVLKQTYTNDGIQVDNIYFDNTVSLNVRTDEKKIYGDAIKKLLYAKAIPSSFLSQAVFVDLDYNKADKEGLHFNAVFAIPDEKLSYIVDTVITPTGKVVLKQEE